MEKVQRLETSRCRWQEYAPDNDKISYPKVVVAAIHSHISLNDIISQFSHVDEFVMIAMPCCIPLEIEGVAPKVEYDDWGVLSPKRTIKIWRGHIQDSVFCPENKWKGD